MANSIWVLGGFYDIIVLFYMQVKMTIISYKEMKTQKMEKKDKEIQRKKL